MLRRRLRQIIVLIGACTTITEVTVNSLEPKYTTKAALVPERTDTRPFALESELQNPVRGRSTAEAEMELIPSR